MPKLRSILPALALAATLHAQLTPLQDPANLAGERVSPQDPADTLPLNHGAPALQQLLAKLRTRASLMLIVAHPDDEDGGLLTYESRGQGARVAMLTLTRGEGGQNLMSADFDDALGLIRTQELLAADRYFGVDQFFGTEVDFGFSKTKEESFQKWTHDRVLYDAVRAVRLYRPLVLASVFVGGPTDGHGQHQVAGEIAQEVFVAAADPNVFPEMIQQGLLPWAPLKVYARVPFSRVTAEGMYDYATGKTIPTRFHNYVTGQDSTAVPTATVLVHEGDKPSDPTLAAAMGGDTFVQYARRGLALQKTQIGPNVRLAPPGRSDTGYTLMASRLNCVGVPQNTGCPILSDSGKGGITSLLPTTEQSLFEGIDTSLPGIATLASAISGNLKVVLSTNLRGIDQNVTEAQERFDPKHLELTTDPLRTALITLNSLITDIEIPGKWKLSEKQQRNILHELRIKRVQLNNALVLALGLTLDPMTKAEHPSYAATYTTADPSLYTNVRITNHSSVPVRLVRLHPGGNTAYKPASPSILSPGKYSFAEATARYLSPQPPTRPFFSRPDIEQPFYNVSDANLRNAPATPAPMIASATVEFRGTQLEMAAVVPDGETVLYRGAPAANLAYLPPRVAQAAVIIPPVSVDLRRSAGAYPYTSKEDIRSYLAPSPSAFGVLPVGTSTFQVGAKLSVHVYEDSILGPARIGPKNIPVTLLAPSLWQVSLASYNSSMEPVLEHFTVTPGPLQSGQSYPLTAKATFQGHDYTESFRPVGYPGLPYTNYYTPATYRATAVDVTTAPNLRIAYLPGTGDTVPDFLPNLGITPTLLTLKDLTPANLKQYDAVLLGVRAYAALPALAGPGSQPLLDYSKAGGVVIAQYNTAHYGDAEAPFPLAVPGDPAHNVVEETQPVALLQPMSPLLTWPNKITPADFDHWVAERGHSFAATWSPEYQPLLETHDAGQDPQQGGLLVARTGKGAYIYCALALYRQLPEGVPGAYRLLANLLSLAKNPAYQAH